MPVWLLKRGSQHQQHVGLVHEPAGHRRAAAAEHAGRERVVVGEMALGLVGGYHRRAGLLRQRLHLLAVEAGAVADDDHRALRLVEQSDRVGDRLRRRRDRLLGQPALGCLRLGLAGRQRLYLVGEDQVRDVALEQCVLAGERHQLGVLRVEQHRLAPSGDGAEGAGEVDLLKRARS